jgi:uncharacterized protein with NRDE domain
MCLVFLAWHRNADVPVMVGANREESRRRPTTSPVCVRNRSLRCLLAGADTGPDGTFPEIGTWLGVNETGLVVAVTNRRDGELDWKDQVRSRGLLAVALLGYPDAEEAAQFAQGELMGGGFGGSNFLIASDQSAFVVQAPSAPKVVIETLSPGVHVLTNLDVNDAADPRIRYVQETLEPDHFITSARRICRDDRIVIWGAERDTVSSSLVTIGGEVGFYHVMGDPRDGEYEQFGLFLC